jgi:hypothetical protein
MKRSEWLELVELIGNLWPGHAYPPGTVAAGWEMVQGLDAGEVRAAVMRESATKREFPPPVGALRADVAELADDAPAWGAVWNEIMVRIVEVGYYADLTEDGNLVREGVLTTWTHPLIGGLVKMVGWKELCTAPLSELRTFEAQCRNKYEAIARRRLEDAGYAGLPTAGLKRLERGARGQPTRLGESLRLPERTDG